MAGSVREVAALGHSWAACSCHGEARPPGNPAGIVVVGAAAAVVVVVVCTVVARTGSRSPLAHLLVTQFVIEHLVRFGIQLALSMNA